MAADAGAPRSAIGTSRACPLAVSTVQIANSRSNAMVLPSAVIDGQRTWPSLKAVIAFAAPLPPAAGALQMFCAPLRSDMKYSVFAAESHIGHASLAPPLVTGS